MKVSIRDLSAKTGFSPATVSNALNGKRGVNKETAEEILRVAKEVGYISENVIRKIKLVIFRKTGVIIDDTPFFSSIITGFEQECRKANYEMLICNIDHRDRQYEAQVKELLQETDSAIVLLATEMLEGDLDLFRGAFIPLLLLDCWEESMDFSAVLINNADAALMATELLIKNNHRKIGYIRGSFRIKGFRSRYRGYQLALMKEKIDLNQKYIATVEPTLNGAYTDMLKYLEANRKDLPTAFFADNDLIALGAMRALRERGYQIPQDVSIVGFDDLPFCEISSPRLTTVKVPNVEMGRLAARRIIEMIGSEERVTAKVQVCTKMILRETVCPPKE